MTYLESVVISLNYIIVGGWILLFTATLLSPLILSSINEHKFSGQIKYHYFIFLVSWTVIWALLTIFVPSPAIFK